MTLCDVLCGQCNQQINFEISCITNDNKAWIKLPLFYFARNRLVQKSLPFLLNFLIAWIKAWIGKRADATLWPRNVCIDYLDVYPAEYFIWMSVQLVLSSAKSSTNKSMPLPYKGTLHCFNSISDIKNYCCLPLFVFLHTSATRRVSYPIFFNKIFHSLSLQVPCSIIY